MSKGVSPVVAEVLLIGIAIAAVSSAAVFLQGTMGGIQDNVDDWLGQEDREQSSEITIDYGYNESGYLVVDLRNSGSYSFAIVEEGNKTLNMYLNGRPQKWSFVSGSEYSGDEQVILDPSSVVRINTTEPFPSTGNSVEVEFAGPYGVSSSYICFNKGGSCEG